MQYHRHIGTVPNLQTLNLSGNNIGREGCITLSNVLQREGSTLTGLHLVNAGIVEEGADIIAASLKHNTKLEELNLTMNKITEKGYLAFLKILNDVSSIESTYTSNHTLTKLNLRREGPSPPHSEALSWITSACEVNRNSRNPEAAGRAKVIKYQLNSQVRKELCELQGIEELSGNIFTDIDAILLPNILALIGNEHGQSELYTTLVPTAPELLSFIDRKLMIDNEMAKNVTQITAHAQQIAVLSAKNDLLSRRREMIGQGRSQISVVEGGNNVEGVRANNMKRQRSSSF